MPVLTQCTHCGKQYRVNDDRVGRPFKCPSCGQAFLAAALVAPASATAPAPPPPTSPPPPSNLPPLTAPAVPPLDSHEPEDMGFYQCDGKLVLDRQADLPMICVKCGEAATTRVKKRYAQSFGGSVHLKVPLCDAHRSTKSRLLLVTWLIFIASFFSFYGAIANESGTLGWTGLILFVASMILAVITTIYLGYPSRIDRDYLWVKGLGSRFIEKLPPF